MNIDEPTDEDPLDVAQALSARDQHASLQIGDFFALGMGYLAKLQFFATGILAVGFVVSSAYLFVDLSPAKVGMPVTPENTEPTFRLPIEAAHLESSSAFGNDDSAVRIAPQPSVRPMPPTSVQAR